MTLWHRLQRRPLLYLWLPLIAWLGLIFYLSAQPNLPKPELGWVGTLLSNGAHLFEYGMLAALWARALAGSTRGSWSRRTVLLAFVLTMLYALSDEFHQYFVPGRHADPKDLLFDAFGATLGLWVWSWLWRRSISPKPMGHEPYRRPTSGEAPGEDPEP